MIFIFFTIRIMSLGNLEIVLQERKEPIFFDFFGNPAGLYENDGGRNEGGGYILKIEDEEKDFQATVGMFQVGERRFRCYGEVWRMKYSFYGIEGKANGVTGAAGWRVSDKASVGLLGKQHLLCWSENYAHSVSLVKAGVQFAVFPSFKIGGGIARQEEWVEEEYRSSETRTAKIQVHGRFERHRLTILLGGSGRQYSRSSRTGWGMKGLFLWRGRKLEGGMTIDMSYTGEDFLWKEFIRSAVITGGVAWKGENFSLGLENRVDHSVFKKFDMASVHTRIGMEMNVWREIVFLRGGWCRKPDTEYIAGGIGLELPDRNLKCDIGIEKYMKDGRLVMGVEILLRP